MPYPLDAKCPRYAPTYTRTHAHICSQKYPVFAF